MRNYFPSGIGICSIVGLGLLTAACSHGGEQQQASAGSSQPPPMETSHPQAAATPHPQRTSAHATATRAPGNTTMIPVTADTVRQIQSELQRDGFYTGPIDGIVGPQTREALAVFQQHHSLQRTAVLDWPTLQQLASASQAGPSTGQGGSVSGSSAPPRSSNPPSNQPGNNPPSGQSGSSQPSQGGQSNQPGQTNQ